MAVAVVIVPAAELLDGARDAAVEPAVLQVPGPGFGRFVPGSVVLRRHIRSGHVTSRQVRPRHARRKEWPNAEGGHTVGLRHSQNAPPLF